VIALLVLGQLGGSTLNLNQQPIESRQSGGRLSTTRQYAIDCRTNMTCVVDGGVLLLSSSGGSGGSGAPVDAGYVVWSAAASTGSTNERVLSNGTNTTIDTATPGQIQVDLSGTIAQALGGTGTGALTCAAGERLTSNGAVYSCSALPAGGSSYDGGYNVVQDEGVDLTKRTTLDFTGAGVSCVDTGSKTQCTISGGGSGGLSPYVLSFGGF